MLVLYATFGPSSTEKKTPTKQNLAKSALQWSLENAKSKNDILVTADMELHRLLLCFKISKIINGKNRTISTNVE